MLQRMTEYHRPERLQEAVMLLRREGRTSAILAGGTELLGRQDHEVEAVVDLGRLGLSGVERLPDGSLRIGAMTTLKALMNDPQVQSLADGILARAAELAAPATIRAAATVGGTLAGRKGGHEIPTVLSALRATVILATPDLQELPVDELISRRTEVTAGAVITHVTIPAREGARGGLSWVSRSPADRAIVVAAAVIHEGETRVAVSPEDGDHRASPEYRSWVVPVLIRRAVDQCRGESA